MLRLVAHSASPYPLPRLFAALAYALGRPGAIEPREERLAALVQRRHCLLTTSGRFALYAILRTLGDESGGKKAILPAYAGPTVVNAVRRAGLTPVFCDLARGKLDFDFDQLQALAGAGAAAVIAVNFFGLIGDYGRLRSIARTHGLLLVEDACPSLGGYREGKPSGSLGDCSCFSFGLSKPLSAAGGGAILTDGSERFAKLREIVARTPGGGRSGRRLLLALAARLLLQPRLYFLARLLPYGFEREDFDFAPDREGRMPRRQAALVSGLLGELPALTAIRRRNYLRLEEALAGSPEVELFRHSAEEIGAALRFPCLCRDRAHRERLTALLRRIGVQADPYYRLERQDYFVGLAGRFPVSADYAERLLTLPTHPYLRPGDAERIGRTLASGSPAASSAGKPPQTPDGPPGSGDRTA